MQTTFKRKQMIVFTALCLFINIIAFPLFPQITHAGNVTVTVTDTPIGKVMPYVGYSTGTMNTENQYGWLKYQGINTVRHWVVPAQIVRDETLSEDDAVNDLTSFDDKKALLRANPEASTYIYWSQVDANMTSFLDPGNKVLYKVNFAMSKYKEMGIDPLIEMHGATEWVSGSWSNYWKNWKRIYAVVYYLAKNYDVHMFQTPNEPDALTFSGAPGFLNLVIRFYSDAVHSAIADVNANYGKSLVPIVNGPVICCSNTTNMSYYMYQNIRKDYADRPISYNNVDWYDKHAYTTEPDQGSLINSIHTGMDTYLPAGVARLPITYSEWNYEAGGVWQYLNVSGDSPSVTSIIGQRLGNNMADGVLGMYMFKYSDIAVANSNVSTYHYWEPRDRTKDIAYHKPITASSEQAGYEASNANDADISDSSLWRSSTSATGPQTLTIDLQGTYTLKSAVVTSGLDNGRGPDTNGLSSFWLESWDGSSWTAIPGSTFTAAKSIQFINFATPVTGSQVRLVTNTAGEVKVRGLSLSEDYYTDQIGGPLKVSEVEHMFAEGFMGNKDLLTTTITGSSDSGNKAYSSYDPASNNYYIWLPRTTSASEPVSVNLAGLDVAQGTVATVKEVSARYFGEVSKQTAVSANKILSLGTQPAASVWLVTIPKGTKYKTTSITANEDAAVQIGSNSNTNYGTDTTLTIRQSDSSTDNNSVAYMKFDLGSHTQSDIKMATLTVTGSAYSNYSMYAYLIDNDTWNEQTINGSNSPNLNRNAAFAEGVGASSWPVGTFTFTPTAESVTIDVTKYVKEHPDKNLSFMLVHEKRNPRPEEVNDSAYITIDSKEGVAKPTLNIYEVDPDPSPPINEDNFTDGFENGLLNWATSGAGTTYLEKHSGNQSYLSDGDIDYISKTFASSYNKIAKVWFFDDASDTSEDSMVFVDNTTNARGFGVRTGISTDKYIYRVGSTHTVTSIPRTTGWHELKFDYTSGSDLKLSIDNTLVATVTGQTSFDRIWMGDQWSGTTSNVYFDDVELVSSMPPVSWEIYDDGFEAGLAEWTISGASTSTVQKHKGTTSYLSDGDIDYISKTFEGNNNKIANVWFYDDASDTTEDSMVFVDNITNVRGVGVRTGVSTSKYIYRVGSTHTVTSIPRTTGWHEMKFDYTSGSDLKLFIDKTLVATVTGQTYFNRIWMGDNWSGSTSNVYYDDVEVEFYDGFEDGLSNWTTTAAGTSTVQAHLGSTSYLSNDDIDSISKSFSTNYNKIAKVWFYDNASDTSEDNMVFVDDTTNLRGVGVRTAISSNNYIYRVGGAHTVTSIPRTTGWHEMKFDYTSGNDLKLYIDNTLVGTLTGLTSFNRIWMGDTWNVNTSNVYYDDVEISN